MGKNKNKQYESVWEMANRLLGPDLREGRRLLIEALRESKDPEIVEMFGKLKKRKEC